MLRYEHVSNVTTPNWLRFARHACLRIIFTNAIQSPVKKQRPEKTPARPHAVDERSKAAGLRSIAVLEALKGIAVLAVGFGVLHLIHKDVGEAAERLVRRLHMNPDRHMSRVFIDAAEKMTDAKIWALAAGALAYSTVRFVEAYGLWNRRVWAEWFALLSGALYLPWELYEAIDHPSPLHEVLLLVNLIIVLYMGWVRWADTRPIRDA